MQKSDAKNVSGKVTWKRDNEKETMKKETMQNRQCRKNSIFNTCKFYFHPNVFTFMYYNVCKKYKQAVCLWWIEQLNTNLNIFHFNFFEFIKISVLPIKCKTIEPPFFAFFLSFKDEFIYIESAEKQTWTLIINLNATYFNLSKYPQNEVREYDHNQGWLFQKML